MSIIGFLKTYYPKNMMFIETNHKNRWVCVADISIPRVLWNLFYTLIYIRNEFKYKT